MVHFFILTSRLSSEGYIRSPRRLRGTPLVFFYNIYRILGKGQEPAFAQLSKALFAEILLVVAIIFIHCSLRLLFFARRISSVLFLTQFWKSLWTRRSFAEGDVMEYLGNAKLNQAGNGPSRRHI